MTRSTVKWNGRVERSGGVTGWVMIWPRSHEDGLHNAATSSIASLKRLAGWSGVTRRLNEPLAPADIGRICILRLELRGLA